MTWFVPGRIEVLGKHTDYAGGRSLLAAAEFGVTVSADDLTDAAPGQFKASSSAVVDDVLLSAGQDNQLPRGHWGCYVQAAVDRLSVDFGPLKAARIRISSDLPLASGMSSSSALVVGVALALADHNHLWDTDVWHRNITDRIDLAAYLATVENGMSFKELTGTAGVGTFGGSEDHTAMLNCKAGSLSVFTFAPTVFEESVVLPKGWTFVIAVSGALAEKTGAALGDYNRASQSVTEIVSIWNESTGESCQTLAQVLSSDEQAEQALREMLDSRPDLRDRLDAFITESQIVIPRAVTALQQGDLAAFGEAADLSHQNADQILCNQIAETNALQRLARELGASASAGFGAGFGGSVWALVRDHEASEFAATWLQRYLEEFPEHSTRATTLVSAPGDGARRID